MGKVQNMFGNGRPGAVTRSADEIVISVKNAHTGDIPFGTPVFLTDAGAVPFDTGDPQEFSSFLGFAVRVADRTPDTYPRDQFSDPPEGVWHAGDVMEVLVRGDGGTGERPDPQPAGQRVGLLRSHREQTQHHLINVKGV